MYITLRLSIFIPDCGIECTVASFNKTCSTANINIASRGTHTPSDIDSCFNVSTTNLRQPLSRVFKIDKAFAKSIFFASISIALDMAKPSFDIIFSKNCISSASTTKSASIKSVITLAKAILCSLSNRFIKSFCYRTKLHF